jgi:tRNA-modifying protein YgfZ
MTAQSRSRDRIFFDLSSRVKLRVTGADRLRFLQGQITNDIRTASNNKSIEACVLNAKGKMEAHLFAHTDGDAYLMDADPALASTLQARLERYVIADDVTIEDMTAQLSIFHLIGVAAPEIAIEAREIVVNRFGIDGQDFWIDASRRDAFADELAKTLKFCDEDCAELFRIENGIPRWGRELTNEIIPVEANLEERGIDYEKGCYIGQETISRMKMSGQRNKQLCGLVSLKGDALLAGSKLIPDGETKEVGWITSAARSGESEIALAFVKRGFNAVGSKLSAVNSEGSAVVEIVDLPFGKSRSM